MLLPVHLRVNSKGYSTNSQKWVRGKNELNELNQSIPSFSSFAKLSLTFSFFRNTNQEALFVVLMPTSVF